jgi:hypothetical protein
MSKIQLKSIKKKHTPYTLQFSLRQTISHQKFSCYSRFYITFAIRIELEKQIIGFHLFARENIPLLLSIERSGVQKLELVVELLRDDGIGGGASQQVNAGRERRISEARTK